MVFRTPGLNAFCPQLMALREKGCVVTSEMEAFFAVCPCTIFGVTGSDGKTTTTTLIAKLLEGARKDRLLRRQYRNTAAAPGGKDAQGRRGRGGAFSSFQLMGMHPEPRMWRW